MNNNLQKRRTDPIIYPLVGWLLIYIASALLGGLTARVVFGNIIRISGLAIAISSGIWCNYKIFTTSDPDKRTELNNTLVQIVVFSIFVVFPIYFLISTDGVGVSGYGW